MTTTLTIILLFVLTPALYYLSFFLVSKLTTSLDYELTNGEAVLAVISTIGLTAVMLLGIGKPLSLLIGWYL